MFAEKMGRIGTCLIAFGLLTASCTGQTLDRVEASTAIGAALEAGIEDSLALASAELTRKGEDRPGMVG